MSHAAHLLLIIRLHALPLPLLLPLQYCRTSLQPLPPHPTWWYSSLRYGPIWRYSLPPRGRYSLPGACRRVHDLRLPHQAAQAGLGQAALAPSPGSKHSGTGERQSGTGDSRRPARTALGGQRSG